MGDEAILESLARQARVVAPHAELYSFTFGPAGHAMLKLGDPDDPSEASRRHELFRPGKADPRRLSISAFLLRAQALSMLLHIEQLDALAYAGGYWLHDLNPVNFAAISGVLRIARGMGRRVGVIGVGAGPLESSAGKRRVRLALENAEALTVRDEHSRRVLIDAGLSRVELTADPALELPSAPQSEAELILERAGLDPNQPLAIITPCAWFRMSEFYSRRDQHIAAMERSLAIVADGLAEAGMQLLMLASMAPEDTLTSRRILSLMRGQTATAVIEAIDLLPGQVQALIGRARLLVSMRLHPLIFGLNCGVPLVAVDYDAKVRELCGRAGIEQWMVDPGQGDFSGAALDLVRSLLDDPSKQLAMAARGRSAMVARLAGNAAAIRRLVR
ncbi:MAG: polysaccharide pyruvyl transferase family protein [Candidatus Alcyoniella australis]|nr:polysaccharide pyruvyl transferase family protein [Candidatus Alcyoniella australis]